MVSSVSSIVSMHSRYSYASLFLQEQKNALVVLGTDLIPRATTLFSPAWGG